MENATATITDTVTAPDVDVVRRFKNPAASNNRPLKSELRKLTAGKPHIPSEVLIRQDRDGDHGRVELPVLTGAIG